MAHSEVERLLSQATIAPTRSSPLFGVLADSSRMPEGSICSAAIIGI